MDRITRAHLFLTGGTNLLCVLLVLLGCLLGLLDVRRALEFKRAELLASARSLGETINPGRVRKLQADPSDFDSPAYARLHEQMTSVLPLMAPAVSVSLLAESPDGELVYLVDARPSGAAAPGDRMVPPSDEFLAGFRTGKPVVSAPYRAGDAELWAAIAPLSPPGDGTPRVSLLLQAGYPGLTALLRERALVPICGGILLILVIQIGRRVVARPRKPGLLLAESLWALSIGLVLAGLFSSGADWYEFRTHRGAFSTLSHLESGSFLRELKELRDGYLEGLGRFFESSDHVDRDEFARYAGYLTSVPYIDAVAWAPARSNGDGAPASFVVGYSTPEGLPFLPEGVDLQSIQTLEKAVAVALSERFPTLSGALPEGGVRYACRAVALRAVSDSSGIPTGMVAIVVNLEAMLGSSMLRGDEPNGGVLDLRLRRILPGDDCQTLYAVPGGPSPELDRDPPFKAVRHMFMMGQTFELETLPGPGFDAMHPRDAGRVSLYAGVLVSSLVALLTGLFWNWRGAMLRLVDMKTASLTLSELASKKLANLYRSISEGVMITDPKGFIEECNSALEELTGYSLEELRGNKPSLFSARGGQYGDDFLSTIRETGVWQGEIWNRKKDGEVYPVWISVSPVRDAHGILTNYTVVMHHIGDIKSEQERLNQLAYHDFLTGLPNRALFMDRLEMALARARRERNMLAVVFLDLDRFKTINDSFGHETGDKLLASVAERLGRGHREQDTVARLAGDEFVFLFEGLHSEEDLSPLLDRIRSLFDRPFDLAGVTVSVECSLGASFYPGDGGNPQSLLDAADRAMYAEKAMKRGRRGEVRA